uniref:Uncharacterized protein n=1 Tax=Salix viminalis TaxID=40686 RepID=A0A6N2MU75_SALVM
MEQKMEASPPLIAKKVSNILRLIFLMIQKGMLKSKLMLDLHFLMNRGKILRKALNDIIVQQHSTLSCISHDVHMSFISPREYEFSCSGSPAYKFYSYKQPYYQARRRKSYARGSTRHHLAVLMIWRRVSAPVTGQLRDRLWWAHLGGLERGARWLDKDADEDCHVDKEAEKFIEMFYKELRSQKETAARSTIKPSVGEAASWQGSCFNLIPPTLSSWANAKSLYICKPCHLRKLILDHRIQEKKGSATE